MSTINPIYLFSDSQLLFWKRNGHLFLKDILTYVSNAEPKAVYIGYSNGNQPEYFDIFRSAMENIGITHTRMLGDDYSKEDQAFMEEAHVILLAGGDAIRGWKKIKSVGLNDTILRRYSEGAVLIGVSAGAMQLGLCVHSASNKNSPPLDALQLAPFVISAHEEAEEWPSLKKMVLSKGEYTKGIGIPFGAGFIYRPDHTIEPIKSSLVEVINDGDNFAVVNILSPDTQITNSSLQ